MRCVQTAGQNPAAGAPNAGLNRAALRELDWMVVRDWFEHESASFWYADPAVDDPKKIKTEIFFFPAASCAEKDGTLTNTDRLLQWHEKAADPPGDCRSDTWFFYHIGRRLKELYRESKERRDQAIQNLTFGPQVKIGFDPTHIEVTGITIAQARAGTRPA